MIIRLFSVFDPSTKFNLSINWISIIIVFFLFPTIFWTNSGRAHIILIFFSKNILKELQATFNSSNLKNVYVFISLLLLLIVNNLLGILPYIFTPTTHIVITLSLSLILWIAQIIFGVVHNVIGVFSHILPLRTPRVLIIFIILVETIRNIIRPLTLAIRLMANIIAGHLLLSLMGRGGLYKRVLVGQVLLILLEIGVSVIQAYVFITLISLYFKEIF